MKRHPIATFVTACSLLLQLLSPALTPAAMAGEPRYVPPGEPGATARASVLPPWFDGGDLPQGESEASLLSNRRPSGVVPATPPAISRVALPSPADKVSLDLLQEESLASPLSNRRPSTAASAMPPATSRTARPIYADGVAPALSALPVWFVPPPAARTGQPGNWPASPLPAWFTSAPVAEAAPATALPARGAAETLSLGVSLGAPFAALAAPQPTDYPRNTSPAREPAQPLPVRFGLAAPPPAPFLQPLLQPPASGLTITAVGTTELFMDFNNWCIGNPSQAGPDGGWYHIRVTNPTTETYTGLELQITPAISLTIDDGTRYLDTLGPGQIVDVFVFVDYYKLRDWPLGCRNCCCN
jgi:hypothetical protein